MAVTVVPDLLQCNKLQPTGTSVVSPLYATHNSRSDGLGLSSSHRGRRGNTRNSQAFRACRIGRRESLSRVRPVRGKSCMARRDF